MASDRLAQQLCRVREIERRPAGEGHICRVLICLASDCLAQQLCFTGAASAGASKDDGHPRARANSRVGVRRHAPHTVRPPRTPAPPRAPSSRTRPARCAPPTASPADPAWGGATRGSRVPEVRWPRDAGSEVRWQRYAGLELRAARYAGTHPSPRGGFVPASAPAPRPLSRPGLFSLRFSLLPPGYAGRVRRGLRPANPTME